MRFFPDLSTFVSFGSLSITWYAVLILTGAMIAYGLSLRTFKKWGYSEEILENYLIPLLMIGILGARIYYVIFQWEYYAQNPSEILMIWHGGLAIHGGLIAGVIFSYFYFRHYKISFMRMFDLIMPHVLIAQAFGRWGNFCNQEAYGGIVDEAYFNGFPSFIKDNMYIMGAYRQPTFLYESICNLVGFLLIVFVFRKHLACRRGDSGFAYFVWYGTTRFFIEGMRTDSLMAGGLRMAQIVSIILVIVGVLGLLGIWHKLFHLYRKPVVLIDEKLADKAVIHELKSQGIVVQTLESVRQDKLLEACYNAGQGHDDVIVLSNETAGADALALYTIATDESVQACRHIHESKELIAICKEERAWNNNTIW